MILSIAVQENHYFPLNCNFSMSNAKYTFTTTKNLPLCTRIAFHGNRLTIFFSFFNSMPRFLRIQNILLTRIYYIRNYGEFSPITTISSNALPSILLFKSPLYITICQTLFFLIFQNFLQSEVYQTFYYISSLDSQIQNKLNLF